MATLTLDAEKAQIMDRLMGDMKRAAELGLVPQDGARISQRGEFIIEPSNVEEDENRKMRNYRHKDYGTSGKMLHAWPEGEEAPVTLVVYNAAEERNAIALGWSAEPVHGPGGRLGVEAPVVEDAPVVVRELAAPGKRQPFEQEAKVEAVEPSTAAPKKRGPKSKKVQ